MMYGKPDPDATSPKKIVQYFDHNRRSYKIQSTRQIPVARKEEDIQTV